MASYFQHHQSVDGEIVQISPLLNVQMLVFPDTHLFLTDFAKQDVRLIIDSVPGAFTTLKEARDCLDNCMGCGLQASVAAYFSRQGSENDSGAGRLQDPTNEHLLPQWSAAFDAFAKKAGPNQRPNDPQGAMLLEITLLYPRQSCLARWRKGQKAAEKAPHPAPMSPRCTILSIVSPGEMDSETRSSQASAFDSAPTFIFPNSLCLNVYTFVRSSGPPNVAHAPPSQATVDTPARRFYLSLSQPLRLRLWAIVRSFPRVTLVSPRPRPTSTTESHCALSSEPGADDDVEFCLGPFLARLLSAQCTRGCFGRPRCLFTTY